MLLMKLLEENTGRRKEPFQTGKTTALSDRQRQEEIAQGARQEGRAGKDGSSGIVL
jgi:hypothetical protein